MDAQGAFVTGEGSVSADRNPSSDPRFARITFSHKGRRKKGRSRSSKRKHHMDLKVRDSNGALLAEGDTVTLIKDLKLKGSSTVLKRGTVIRNIHLTDNEDEIEGRTDKVKGLVLRTEFLKKALGSKPSNEVVMAGLVPAIHVLAAAPFESRGCPSQARA